jgi:hypothetical protein
VIRWPMIIERECSMVEPEFSNEQMETQVGRLAMLVEARTRMPIMRCRTSWKARFGAAPYDWPRSSTIQSAKRGL